MTTLRVAVDFGASNTCAALTIGPGPPQLVLVDGAPVLPSAVCAAPGGGLFVGAEAHRQAAVDPARYEPHPKRRIDDRELLLGDTVVPVVEVVRAVLARVVAQARARTGAPVDLLVLTHPAGWGATRTGVLRAAASPLAREIVLVPEPVAAAWCYATELLAPEPEATPCAAGQALAVVDLGGATLDISIVRRTGTSLEVLATAGDPAFGGADLDQLLFEHVGTIAAAADPAGWLALTDGRCLDARRRARALRTDVRTAKETLSRHPYADVPMPPPFPDVHVTRTEFEQLVAPALSAVVAVLDTALDAAARRCGGARPTLGAVFLTGGSSRVPMLARLLREHTGLIPGALELPETAVALGALRCAPPGGTPPPAVSSVLQLPSGRPSRPDATARERRWRWGAAAGLAAAGLAAAGLAAAGLALVAGFAITAAGGRAAGTTVTTQAYRFTLPAGWEQRPGDPARHEVRLFPAGRPDRPAVHVQANRLGYDSAALPGRPVRELRDRLAAAPSGRYSAFAPTRTVAGRAVVFYREHPADGSTVDWHLVFQGHTQISVGCPPDPATRPLVGPACEEVVRTLRIQE